MVVRSLIGDWTESVLSTKAKGGLEMDRKQQKETEQLSVVVDLNKSPFTICVI